jgi:DNA-binding CsgD family transcriptional regulator
VLERAASHAAVHRVFAPDDCERLRLASWALHHPVTAIELPISHAVNIRCCVCTYIVLSRLQNQQDVLGDADFTAAWEAGRSQLFDLAVVEAIALADAALASHRTAPARAITGLSVREIDVLRLLADARADKAIANALFISPRTASSHVAAIIAKLGVESRTAAVALALRSGLV